jgi:hypothetical protein
MESLSYLSIMAISNHNVVTKGASGTLGGQIVFRQRFGKTIMCKLPRPYPPKTATQLANQERFKRANDFAKAAIKDPVKKAYYKSIAKPTQTAFNAAFQDAYHKPKVEAKTEGEKVIIKTKGKHRIEKVKVGEGFAVLKNKQWEYENKQPGLLLKVFVYDVAGNICSVEIQT